ncbi:MAG: hypothetical protein QXH91_01130 [Candidatus Bathyarchaeia archaeon]
MKLLPDFDEALKVLTRQKENMTLILGDWDNGLKLEKGLNGEEVIKKIKEASEEYGNRFSWRAFSENIDLYWNGEGALLCEGEPIQENKRKVFLETDFRRFPGIAIFWDVEFSEPEYTHAEVEDIYQGNEVVYLRLLRLFKEVGGDGSNI